MLTPDMAVIAEVGDSWFNTQKLRLPRGTEYEMQVCGVKRLRGGEGRGGL
jgi:TPP-dependent 2-oxoacid decarboxylase